MRSRVVPSVPVIISASPSSGAAMANNAIVPQSVAPVRLLILSKALQSLYPGRFSFSGLLRFSDGSLWLDLIVAVVKDASDPAFELVLTLCSAMPPPSPAHNELFFTLLMAHTEGGARTIVLKFQSTKDGRAAYQALVARITKVDKAEYMRCHKKISKWVFPDSRDPQSAIDELAVLLERAVLCCSVLCNF